MKKFKPIPKEKIQFLNKFIDGPVFRLFLSSAEIKQANQLVKEGLLIKGCSVERPHTVIFYLDESFRRDLLTLNP